MWYPGKRAFVYGSTIAQVEDGNPGASSIAAHHDTEPAQEAEEQAVPSEDRIEIRKSLHDLSALPPSQRLLLDHFMSCTTVSLSCHPIIQHDFCKVLMPMALQTPHLLAAILAFAGVHRIALGLPQSTSQLEFLKCVSLQQLRAVLTQPSSNLTDAVVATTLTLCTADIISDSRMPGSWRLHLEGTAAIISAHLQQVRDSPEALSSTASLLWRWYLSIEALSLLCGNLAISPSPRSRMALQMRQIIKNNEIDDMAGFSASLIPVFGDINLLAQESSELWRRRESQHQHQEQPPPEDDIGVSDMPNELIRSRCYQLINDVRRMLANHEPRFRPLVDASLSSLHKMDFVSLDETYHHVALLHLYRRVLNLPSSSALVQSSVSQIISRIGSMHFPPEPCPGVAVLQPVFTAGCEALEPAQQEDIRGLLSRIETRYGVGNAKSVRVFLEALWVRRSEKGDAEGRMRWDEVMVAMGLDLLPY